MNLHRFCLAAWLLPLAGLAHHSVGGNYDVSRIIEIEGEVTDVLWRNPHVQVTMRVREENGSEQIWDMATTSLSNLRRWQISPAFIAVGDRIRVAGNPAVRSEHGLYLRNVLTTRGEEVLLAPSIGPRWSRRTVEMTGSRRAGVGEATAPELGLFRVWSTPDNIPMLIPRDFSVDPVYRSKLTDSARAAVDEFVWERDNPIANCTPKGMPTIMEAPYPFEFMRDGENILWHQEEYDTVRTIHMAADTSAERRAPALLGYSVGRWEDGRTLVVTTTSSSWGYFDTLGVPLSPAAVMVERFTLDEHGSRLDYTITVTDPSTFIEPVTLGKHWVYYEDAEVGTYACSLAAED